MKQPTVLYIFFYTCVIPIDSLAVVRKLVKSDEMQVKGHMLEAKIKRYMTGLLWSYEVMKPVYIKDTHLFHGGLHPRSGIDMIVYYSTVYGKREDMTVK